MLDIPHAMLQGLAQLPTLGLQRRVSFIVLSGIPRAVEVPVSSGRADATIGLRRGERVDRS